MPESALSVASLVRDPGLEASVARWLVGGRYDLIHVDPRQAPLNELVRRLDDCDVLLIEDRGVPATVCHELLRLGLMLPAVVIGEVTGETAFHEAEVRLPADQLEQLTYSLDAAVSRFLRRGLATQEAPASSAGAPQVSRTAASSGTAIATTSATATATGSATATSSATATATPAQAWRLDDRLKGRLGLLGVFYKRDPSRFLRNLPEPESEELLESLKRTYRDLLLSYFINPLAANQALESFVDTAFFSDLPITKTVQIHMDLIDSFSKELRMQGHKSDFLQDYRLTLLDVMAHLCEMYRRSVPPDVPLVRLPHQA